MRVIEIVSYTYVRKKCVLRIYYSTYPPYEVLQSPKIYVEGRGSRVDLSSSHNIFGKETYTGSTPLVCGVDRVLVLQKTQSDLRPKLMKN